MLHFFQHHTIHKVAIATRVTKQKLEYVGHISSTYRMCLLLEIQSFYTLLKIREVFLTLCCGLLANFKHT